MNSFVYYQTYIFLAAIYGGVVIAFLYDIYIALRKHFRVHRYIKLMQDILFWLCISVVAISVLLYSSNGDLKAGSIVGFFIGAILYKVLLSKYISRIIDSVIDALIRFLKMFARTIKRLYYRIINILLLPLRLIIKVMRPLLIGFKQKTNYVTGKLYTPVRRKTSSVQKYISKEYTLYKKKNIAKKKKALKVKQDKLKKSN